MALTLFAVNNDFFDDIEVEKALPAEKSMKDYLSSHHQELIKRLDESKNLSADDEQVLSKAIQDWKKNGTY